jgi:hypothetical protein
MLRACSYSSSGTLRLTLTLTSLDISGLERACAFNAETDPLERSLLCASVARTAMPRVRYFSGVRAIKRSSCREPSASSGIGLSFRCPSSLACDVLVHHSLHRRTASSQRQGKEHLNLGSA